MFSRGRTVALGVFILFLFSSPLTFVYVRAESVTVSFDAAELEMRFHPPGGGEDCLSCHPLSASPFSTSEMDPPPEEGLTQLSTSSFSVSEIDPPPEAELTQSSTPSFSISETDLPPEAELTHWWFGCLTCHSLHGTTNLFLISEVIETDFLPLDYLPKSGPREVIFTNHLYESGRSELFRRRRRGVRWHL